MTISQISRNSVAVADEAWSGSAASDVPALSTSTSIFLVILLLIIIIIIFFFTRSTATLNKLPVTEKEKLAFLDDDAIGSTWFYHISMIVNVFLLRYVHGCTIHFEQPVDTQQGALFVCYHSTHNSDIYTSSALFYFHFKRVIRALVHRLVVKFNPYFRYFGAVPGERETAIKLLESNFWCGVIPGGAEEALTGHENAYQLVWPADRKGFGIVAQRANKKIYPLFVSNVEEMRFNVFFYVWNRIGGSRLYAWTQSPSSSLPPSLVHVIALIGQTIWLTFTMLPTSFIVPAKITLHFGPAVDFDSTTSIDTIVARSKQSLQRLIDLHQPISPDTGSRLDYRRAVRQRWQQMKEEGFTVSTEKEVIGMPTGTPHSHETKKAQ